MVCSENLQLLVDEKRFKSALVHFSLDAEHGVVKQEHRAELVALLMRRELN